jgi:WD40 repeat protein
VLRGHTGGVIGLEFSADGRRVASSAEDGDAVVWDTRTGTSVERLDLGASGVQALAFSPDRGSLITAGEDGAIRVWDLAGSGRFLARTRKPGAFGFGWVLPSSAGRFTAHSLSVTEDLDRIRFFDTVTGEPTRFADQDCCWGGAFTPDESLFAGTKFGRIWIWDSRTAKLVRENREYPWPGLIIDLAWTPDASRLIVTDELGDMGLVDAETFEPVGKTVHVGASAIFAQPGPNDHTGFALVSDTPAEVASSYEVFSGHGDWVLVDFETGRVTRGNTGFEVFSFSVSPDHRRLAVGGANGEVALVDVASGELVRPPVQGHGVQTYSSAWSADGTRFATVGWDGSVVLWDGHLGIQLGNVLMPEKTLQNVAFLPDDETLLLAPYTDSFYLWDTNGDHAIEFACRAAAGDFDETEWESWFGNRPYQETCP